jgi:hypothetical protein
MWRRGRRRTSGGSRSGCGRCDRGAAPAVTRPAGQGTGAL